MLKISLLKKMVLSSVAVSPLLTTIACAQELTINDAYKQIPVVAEYFDDIKNSNSFEKYNDQDMAYYINYLMNYKGASNPIITNSEHHVEVKIHIPFIAEKEDITDGTLGRVVTIPHGGHNHYIYKTWEQLPPQPYELAATRTYANFRIPITGDYIHWDFTQYKNDLIKNEASLSNNGQIIDLLYGDKSFEVDDVISYWSEEKTTSRELIKDLIKRSLSNSDQSTYFTDIQQDFNIYANRDFILNKDIARQIVEDDGSVSLDEFKELIKQLDFDLTLLENASEYRQTDVMLYTLYKDIKDGEESYLDNVYEGSEFLELEWAYNQVTQSIPQSDAALEFQYSLFDSMARQTATKNHIGSLEFSGTNTMVDWWQQSRPHVKSQELMIEPEILLNANRSQEDEEIFWNYLRSTNIYDTVKSLISDYRNPMPVEYHEGDSMAFTYYDDPITDERVWLMDYANIIIDVVDFYYSPPVAASADRIFEANRWEWENMKSDNPIEQTINNQNNPDWNGRRIGEAIDASWSGLDYDESQMNINWDTDDDATMHNIDFPFINTEMYLVPSTKLYYVTNTMAFADKDDADKLINILGGK